MSAPFPENLLEHESRAVRFVSAWTLGPLLIVAVVFIVKQFAGFVVWLWEVLP